MTVRRVLGIPSAQVGHVWPSVLPHVESAIRHGDGGYAAEDILSAIRNRDMQLWLCFGEGLEAVAVTEIAIRPRKKVLRVVLHAGRNGRAWREIGLPVLEEFGRNAGCREIEMQGRVGWLRVLRDWTAGHIVMRKGL